MSTWQRPNDGVFLIDEALGFFEMEGVRAPHKSAAFVSPIQPRVTNRSHLVIFSLQNIMIIREQILKILLVLRTSLFQKLGVLHWNKINIILEQPKMNALQSERSQIFVDDIVLIAESKEKLTDLTGRLTYENTDTWIWHEISIVY